MSKELKELTVKIKSGSEPFLDQDKKLGIVLQDFWAWSVSDLVSNATRGRLAEFIVAKALSIDTGSVRDEWGAYDLQTKSGRKIEVKSAAYIQSWSQKELSKIIFQVRKTKAWNRQSNLQSRDSKRQADIYVFALLAHQDKQSIDPLNMKQWQFYVLSSKDLDNRTRSQHSITLKTLNELSEGPVGYVQLSQAVEQLKL